jgi:ATP-dependent helicase/DNAse subunit B
VILRGPAGSGKTAAVRKLYRDMLDQTGRPRCLVLVPNFVASQAMRDALLADRPTGVLLEPGVLTFASLAARVLAAAGEQGKLLGAFQRRILLRRIVNSLARAGKLGPLEAVADTPGLMTSLDHSIAELKRAAVQPDLLARAIHPRDDRGRGLVEVYAAYQQSLRQQGAYDVEGRMWQARDVLATAARGGQALPGLESVRAVAADGFTDFTPTQLAILASLGRQVRRFGTP